MVDTLTHGNFPYTESVLARMRGLSGAHFIVASADGKVLQTSLPELEELPASLRELPHAGPYRIARGIAGHSARRHTLLRRVRSVPEWAAR